MTINERDLDMSATCRPKVLVRANPFDYGYQKSSGPTPAPIERPPFTLKEIRDAIPPHCFKRSLLRSFSYVIIDLAAYLTILYCSLYIHSLPKWSRTVVWPFYWLIQGTSMTGLWVLGHECGHHAFSDYKWVNHSVGFCIHSCLLVPYFNWRETHRKHHLNTSSCEHDETHVPPTRSSIQSDLIDLIQESPIYNFVSVVLMLLIGWMPFYLVYNITGPSKYNGKNTNQFSPTCTIFSPKQFYRMVLGNCGYLTVLGCLMYLSVTYGLSNVMFHYGIPYLILYVYFIVIVWLHHTDVFIPHYRGTEWSWLRGAMCTVDRSYGKVVDTVTHEITTTHVVHHLFPSMPFYHAREASEAMSKVIGKYHLKDNTPIWTALWRSVCNCHFVEDYGSIVFWKGNFRQ